MNTCQVFVALLIPHVSAVFPLSSVSLSSLFVPLSLFVSGRSFLSHFANLPACTPESHALVNPSSTNTPAMPDPSVYSCSSMLWPKLLIVKPPVVYLDFSLTVFSCVSAHRFPVCSHSTPSSGTSPAQPASLFPPGSPASAL